MALIFFAFPAKNVGIQNMGMSQIQYHVHQADNPLRHRILMEGDYLDDDGGVGWTSILQFWAFSSQQQGTQAYSVLYAVNPYRSQIIIGQGITIQGWKLHSTFWAYLTPGNVYIRTIALIYNVYITLPNYISYFANLFQQIY